MKLHPRIKRQYTIVGHGLDVVELRHGVWNPTSFTLTDESGSGHLYQLLVALDGSVSTADLAQRTKVPRSEVEALIDHLDQLGVIETSAQNALDYYLDTLVPALQRPSVVATPRTTILIGDRAMTAELKRYIADQTGTALQVPSPDDSILALLNDKDDSWHWNGTTFHEKAKAFTPWQNHFIVTIESTVHPIRLRNLNRLALEAGTPWIHAAVDGPFLLIGPTFVPGKTACYQCLESRILMNMRESENYLRYKRALVEGQVKEAQLPVLSAMMGVLASHTALEVLNFQRTGCSYTKGKLMAVYMPTMEFAFHEVLPVPGCRACGSSGLRDDQELYFDLRSLLQG